MTDRIDELIEKRIRDREEEHKNRYFNMPEPLPSSFKGYFGYTKRLAVRFYKSHPNEAIAMIMFLLFIIALLFSMSGGGGEGNGACPSVNLEDVRKAGALYIAEDDTFTDSELSEIVGAYFGYGDCKEIDKRTIRKLGRKNVK